MNKRSVTSFIVIVMALGTLLIPTLAAASPNRVGGATVVLNFQWIRQGRVGLVRVTGPDLAEVRAVFQERLYYFYPEQDGFVGLIGADMEQDIGIYTMQVWIKYGDGTAERIDQPVEVNYGEFGTFEVTISPSLASLLEPEVNQAEADRLANIMTRFTPERYWNGGFALPSSEEIIAWFGTYRLYNSTYWYRHTGIDIRMPVGTPVKATANGRVMLSELLPIRGGYVLIDHGWGVYSGYAHLSERFVVPGQWVRLGQVIGLSGMNGRSSGAHLHWEMAVGGAWVAPDDFLALNLNVAE